MTIAIRNPRPSRPPRGFTLVEMLAAVAVLIILIFMVTSLMRSASVTISNSNDHLNADDQARLVLDRMQMDFARMLKRNDVYFQFTRDSAGNSKFTFYSETPGFNASGSTATTQSNLSLVTYQVDPTTYRLERIGQGYQWTDMSFSTNAPTLAVPASDTHVLSASVFRMEVAFLMRKDDSDFLITSTAPTPGSQAFQNFWAVMVAIAVIDPNSQKLVNGSSYPSMIEALPAFSGAQTIALNSSSGPDASEMDPILSVWHAAVDNASGFAQTTGIPLQAAQQVRIYQRIFYLQ